MLEFLRSLYNQCVCSVGLMFGMMIDCGPKFYSVPPSHVHMTYRSRSQNLIFWLKFCVEVIKILHHPHLWFSLVNMSQGFS